MNYTQLLQYIVQWIRENHNNEITGNILQDVLIQIVEYTKDNNDVFDADIQNLQDQIDNISIGQTINVFEGVNDPNIIPPEETFSAPDIYVQTNQNRIWIFDGEKWIDLTSEIDVNIHLSEIVIPENINTKSQLVSYINTLSPAKEKLGNENWIFTNSNHTFFLVGKGKGKYGDNEQQIGEENIIEIVGTGSSRQKTVIRQLDYNQMDFELSENRMIAEAINTSGPHICAEDERMLFAVSYVTGGGRAQSVLTKYYRVHQNRTAYGIGYPPVGAGSISPAGEQSTKVRLIDLGGIGSTSVQTAFNQGDDGNPWVISGETYVKAETNTGEKLWKFIGGDGLWGAGSQTATSGDFLLQSEEAQIPTGFITKSSHSWNKVLISSEIGFTLPYNSEKRAYSFEKGGISADKATFKGFNFSGLVPNEFDYDGIEVVLRNHDLSTSVVLTHNSSGVDIPFLFSDATNVELPPKEIATFKYYNGAFHLVSRSKPAKGDDGGGSFDPDTLQSASVKIENGKAERAALTGDVTASQNSNTLTISNGAVTESKLATPLKNKIDGKLDASKVKQDLTAPSTTEVLSTEGLKNELKNKHKIITSSYTLTSADNNFVIFCNGTSITITIDPEEDYPEAFEVFFDNLHSTIVTFVWTARSGWTFDKQADTLPTKTTCFLARVGDTQRIVMRGNSVEQQIIIPDD